jgi:hypothetical protein
VVALDGRVGILAHVTAVTQGRPLPGGCARLRGRGNHGIGSGDA